MADPADGGGTPAAPEMDLAASMVAEMESTASATPAATEPTPASTPAPKPTEPTPAPKPAEPAAVKPAPASQKPVETPKTTTTTPPAAEKPLDWKTAPTQFRTAFEKLKSEFDNKTREYEGKLTTTQQQMQALESRKYLTPEQETRYAELEKQQQALQAELYARDYRESPEFKAKYQGKADKVFQSISNELKSIQVNDENGSPRPATLADFSKIRALGDSQVEQRRMAKQIFGDDADVVIAAARELKTIEDAANDEIEAKRANFQSEREQSQKRQQEELQTGNQVFTNYDKLLVEKFPAYFAPVEGNDEFNKALQEGLKFVDSNSTGFNQKTPEQRAQSAAMMRRFAAAFPAMQVMIKQLSSQVGEYKERVEKLQGSDPGAGGDGAGGTGGGGEEVGGTDALSAEINKLQNMV